MLKYTITARSKPNEKAYSYAKNFKVYFDDKTKPQEDLPNPAELLITSVAACMMKNINRYAKILSYDFEEVEITMTGFRNDAPPYMKKIEYSIRIKTNMPRRKLELLHKNLLKYGTITNTVAKATELTGTIDYLK